MTAMVVGMRGLLLAWMLGGGVVLGTLPEPREWKAPDGTVLKYRWGAPETLEKGKTYPLVLFLHGSGERGSDNIAQIGLGVLPLIEQAKKLNEPFFLIAPQCPAGSWWATIDWKTMRLSAAAKPNPLMDSVLALVESLMKANPVDPQRFYVTGLSMGGFGTWDVLGRAPKRIAAAMPVCGGGDPSLAAKFKDVPIWVFHGETDPIVPVKSARDMIEALEKAGGKPKATIYPETGHDAWDGTYTNPEVIRWLFDQRRK